MKTTMTLGKFIRIFSLAVLAEGIACVGFVYLDFSDAAMSCAGLVAFCAVYGGQNYADHRTFLALS